MCLIIFALDAHPRYPLILAANRDEFFSRPTLPAAFWEDAPNVLGGRDLVAGGTWLGVTRDKRLAAVTYFREPATPAHHLPSRGRLTSDFLVGNLSAERYLEEILPKEDCYGGFNLLLGTGNRLFYHSNRGATAPSISPGIHGLSNGLLDTPWPKVTAGKQALQRLLIESSPEPEELFALLADRNRFPDPLLPDTGLGLQRERHLSPIFVSGSDYGTRSSTVILLDRDNRITFSERSYNERQEIAGIVSFTIDP